jgi:hypothetical protein
LQELREPSSGDEVLACQAAPVHGSEVALGDPHRVLKKRLNIRLSGTVWLGRIFDEPAFCGGHEQELLGVLVIAGLETVSQEFWHRISKKVKGGRAKI